ncbi:hypothetical protein CEQ90_20115 [Lewinellaceae bacterium SD302]|nr:hypothetical protein CEQ90_20115 [Lewinellaceae bacterium SD302]
MKSLFLIFCLLILSCHAVRIKNPCSIYNDKCYDEVCGTISDKWLNNKEGSIIKGDKLFWELFFQQNNECFINIKYEDIVNHLGLGEVMNESNNIIRLRYAVKDRRSESTMFVYFIYSSKKEVIKVEIAEEFID